jgi:hypothetical protein
LRGVLQACAPADLFVLDLVFLSQPLLSEPNQHRWIAQLSGLKLRSTERDQSRLLTALPCLAEFRFLQTSLHRAKRNLEECSQLRLSALQR